MVKRKPRRKFSGRVVRLSTNVTVGALATADVTSGPVTSATTAQTRVISMKAVYSWVEKAQIDGACEIGLAHSDYTAAEIEECLEANASMDVGDLIANEQARRMVRTIGVFAGGGATADGNEIALNNGNPIHTRLNWVLSQGDAIELWMKNGSGVIYTTGSSISVLGSVFVKP